MPMAVEPVQLPLPSQAFLVSVETEQVVVQSAPVVPTGAT